MNSVQLLEVLELVDALPRMRHQHLRLLLEHGGDRERGNVLLDRVEALQRVGRHEEVELADRQQQAVVHVRPARHDGDVEAVSAIGAVDQRLVVAAVLALGHPVGAERHLVERPLRLRRYRRAQHARDGERDDDGDAVQCCSTHSHLADGYRRHNRCRASRCPGSVSSMSRLKQKSTKRAHDAAQPCAPLPLVILGVVFPRDGS